jgi:phosphomannomutase
MKKSRAAVGGESSGHFYFREFSNSDSAILAFLKVAEILSETKKPISRLAAPFRKYFQSGEINFKVENPKKIMLLLLKHFKTLKPKPIISSLDGLSVEFSDWWFNLRPSNTEPLVRLNVEAKTKELLDEKILFLKKTIATFGW